MFVLANPVMFFHLSTSRAGGTRGPLLVPDALLRNGPGGRSRTAEELEVNEKTVRRWIHKGKLTAKRVGKGLRIHRFAVAALLGRDPVGPQLLQRRRGGQLKQLPPPGIRQMHRDRELREQEEREERRYPAQ